MTTQMLTQMLLATVSLCVLCETAVRSRPCAQLLPQPATSMRHLMRSEPHARAQRTQRQKQNNDLGTSESDPRCATLYPSLWTHLPVGLAGPLPPAAHPSSSSSNPLLRL